MCDLYTLVINFIFQPRSDTSCNLDLVSRHETGMVQQLEVVGLVEATRSSSAERHP